MSDAPTCPDCGAPGRWCICVMQARMNGAERREREAIAEAYRYRTLFQAAASLIAHNRARLAKPRGKDEARVLEYLDSYGDGPPALGHFWSGKTDGWINADLFEGAEP